MPTAGRLAGAVIFGLFGWYLAGLTVPFFPESNAPTFWLPAVSFIGLVVGWRICGSRAGHGYNPAVGVGITCGAAIAFISLFILSETNSNLVNIFGICSSKVSLLLSLNSFSGYSSILNDKKNIFFNLIY